MVECASRYNLVDSSVSESPAETSIDLTDPHARPISRRMHHGRLLWTEICWRLMATLVFSIAITAVLYSFSSKDILSRWEKRGFNALAILLSSLVSLCTGSLLGLLGNMVRWPLLASKLHTPVDVDLILGMANPTGSVKLIWNHTVHKRKWCVTTVVVMIYLLVNIIGRLSVAAFGLTFDLNENARIEYPIRMTDWGTKDWLNDSMLSREDSFNRASMFDFIDPNIRHMSQYAKIGLANVIGRDFDFKNSSTYNMTNINGQGLNRVVEGEYVTYSYYLRDYRHEEATKSNTSVVHSSSRCSGGTISLLENQERVVDYGDFIDTETFDTMLNAIYKMEMSLDDDIIWIAPLDFSELYENSACATTYLYAHAFLTFEIQRNRSGVLFECYTCTSHNNSIPGLGLLESSNSNTYNASILLHRVGHYDYTLIGGEEAPTYSARSYSDSDSDEHFATGLGTVLQKDGEYYSNSKIGIAFQGKLHPAHLAARLPLLAILAADIQLPKVTKISGASERLFIDVRLKVKLKQPIMVLLCIFGGQILAIGVVLFCCRKVFIRDYTSSLSIARLLKTTMEDVEGMSTCTGEELAEYLDRKGVMMRYGTRRKGDEALEVDLWNDVEDDFPDAIYS